MVPAGPLIAMIVVLTGMPGPVTVSPIAIPLTLETLLTVVLPTVVVPVKFVPGSKTLPRLLSRTVPKLIEVRPPTVSVVPGFCVIVLPPPLPVAVKVPPILEVPRVRVPLAFTLTLPVGPASKVTPPALAVAGLLRITVDVPLKPAIVVPIGTPGPVTV